jgi:hypothetical protein
MFNIIWPHSGTGFAEIKGRWIMWASICSETKMTEKNSLPEHKMSYTNWTNISLCRNATTLSSGLAGLEKKTTTKMLY